MDVLRRAYPQAQDLLLETTLRNTDGDVTTALKSLQTKFALTAPFQHIPIIIDGTSTWSMPPCSLEPEVNTGERQLISFEEGPYTGDDDGLIGLSKGKQKEQLVNADEVLIFLNNDLTIRVWFWKLTLLYIQFSPISVIM